MSDSVWPHRRQPTRLPHPWDSPGKNTGVGCHFLLQCMEVKSEREVAQSCPTLNDPMDYSLPGSSIHGVFQARVLEWGAIAFSKIISIYVKFCLRAIFLGSWLVGILLIMRIMKLQSCEVLQRTPRLHCVHLLCSRKTSLPRKTLVKRKPCFFSLWRWAHWGGKKYSSEWEAEEHQFCALLRSSVSPCTHAQVCLHHSLDRVSGHAQNARA